LKNKIEQFRSELLHHPFVRASGQCYRRISDRWNILVSWTHRYLGISRCRALKNCFLQRHQACPESVRQHLDFDFNFDFASGGIALRNNPAAVAAFFDRQL
jgi:hypothetical protein